MEYKLIKINRENIDKYKSVWFDVLQLMPGTRNLNMANHVIKIYYDSFISSYNETFQTDFFYYLRALVVNEVPIGFVNGIISYFESGICLQIGTFGIIRRYQKKGYGQILFEEVLKEARECKVNYLWLMPRNPDFWLKMGLNSENSKLINYLYENDDDLLSIKLNDKHVSFDTFISLYQEQDKKKIFVRSERSNR